MGSKDRALKLSSLLQEIRMASYLCCLIVLLSSAALQSMALDGLDTEGPSGCCDWSSCYDPRTGLCLDPCRSTWSQCPPKLTTVLCYNEYLSPFGALPPQCFPDIAPHMDLAEARGISGPAEKVRDEIHGLFNKKNCQASSGLCRHVPVK